MLGVSGWMLAILLDFFLSSLGRNGGNLLDLPMLKLMIASPLYISIACMWFIEY